MISSFSNPLIKKIRKLREKKYREEWDQFFVEGSKFVGEALTEKWAIDQVVYAPELIKGNFGVRLLGQLKKKTKIFEEVTPEIFNHLVSKESIQGIAAVCRKRHLLIDSLKVEPGDLWIALDEVQDPGNLGTILRTSDSVGARGIILLDHSTDQYDPAVIRASMGALFSQKIYACSLTEFEVWKRKNQIPVIGTSGSSSVNYHSFMYTFPMVLLMGSERQGLSAEHLKVCDTVVKIPMVGKSDSLNLAIATGIVLYEIFNQKRDLG